MRSSSTLKWGSGGTSYESSHMIWKIASTASWLVLIMDRMAVRASSTIASWRDLYRRHWWSYEAYH
jgi:hypothetical protein